MVVLERHGYAILQIVHKRLVALFQCALVDSGHLAHRLVDDLLKDIFRQTGKGIKVVHPCKTFSQLFLVDWLPIVALYVGPVFIFVAHLLEQFYQRLLVIVL